MKKFIILILFFSISNFTFAQPSTQGNSQPTCPDLNLVPGMIFPFGGQILSARRHCNCFTFNLQRTYVIQIPQEPYIIPCKDQRPKSYMAVFFPPITQFYQYKVPRAAAQTVGLAMPMINFPLLCVRKKSLIPCIKPVTADNLVLMFGVSKPQIGF
jgi:hypothetical protein